jgi:acylphosphatase
LSINERVAHYGRIMATHPSLTLYRPRAKPTLNLPVATHEEQERRCVHYAGLVQGVGFRYAVRRLSATYPVAGYVQNLPDGRVQVVAEGAPAELNRFLAAIRAGMKENIDDEQMETAPATGEFATFDIRF